jgi:hypothetical protein
MGMYDYLGGEQIKIFYHPIFSSKDIMTGKPSIWHSGGILADFDENSELPLMTGYYKYPQNFIVFDYNWDYEDIWIIKNGKFVNFKKYTELTKEDLGDAVFNYYGSELNISSLQDFYNIKKESKEAKELYDNKEEEIFPEGIYDTIRNKPEYYDSVKSEWDKVSENTYGKFNTKWYKVDQYESEKQLGEFLECYFYMNVLKDGEVYDWHNPMEEYLACKTATIDFIKNNDEIVDKYISWLESTPEEEKYIRKIIQEITA